MKFSTKVLYKKVTNFTLAIALVISSIAAVGPFIFSQSASALDVYSEGFELNADSWLSNGGTITRTPSGAITAADGSFYGSVNGDVFTRWGGYSSTFPDGGYTTSVDVYLDTATADGTLKRIDFSSAINDTSGNHKRDFVTHIGTVFGTPGIFSVSADNNAETQGLTNSHLLNNPITISTNGWYTLTQQFYDNGGQLAVDLSISNESGTELGSWTRTSPLDITSGPGANVGGNRYGWFISTNPAPLLTPLAIDNAKLTIADPIAPATPTNLRFAEFACNGATNINFITPTWDAVADVAGYNYKVTLPGGGTFGPVPVGNVISVSGPFGGQGLSTFSVQSIGANGLLSDWATPCAVTYDTTAPTAPTLVSPLTPAIVNGASVTQSWSSTDSDVHHYIYESYNNEEATSLRWHEEFATTSKTATNVAEATYWWRVKAVDNAGNVSPWSALWKITVDNSVPTTPMIQNPSTEQYFKTTPILNKWSASTDSNGINKYQVEYIYDDGHTFSGGPYREVNGLTTQRNHTPSTSEQGGVTIRVRAMDNAGNYSAWSDPIHYYYDATPPSSTDNLATTINGTVAITQTITDNVAAKNGKLRIWKIVSGGPDNSQFYAIGDLNVDSSNNILYTLDTVNNLYGDGEYIAKFTARDKAGHEIVTQKTFFVDNTAPTVTINEEVFATNLPIISGSVGADAISVDIVVVDQDSNPVSGTVGYVVGEIDWTFTPDAPLANGEYTIVATAEDVLGNAANASGTINVAVVVITPDNEDTPDVDETETTSQTTVTPTTINPAAFAAILGATTDDTTDNGATNNGVSDVEGATTDTFAAVDTDATDGSIFGLAWYWWLLILAALAAITSWIVAAIRRRNEAQS